MRKSIIVAKAENHVIGQDNRLPWHLPGDLQHFKRVTMGHHLIMGRKTFSSIGRLLSGRKLIVVTRNPNYQTGEYTVVRDVPTALAVAERAGETEVFIAGGRSIYQETLALVDKIYLTEVSASFVGDTFFPVISASEWRVVKRTHHPADERHTHAYDISELLRRDVQSRE